MFDPAQALRRIVPSLLSLLVLASCERAPAIYERTDFVMGTVAQVKVVASSPGEAEKALAQAFSELARIEAITTTYSDSSEVSRLNRDGRPRAVGPDLDRVLILARAIAGKSDGAFDPTAGALVALWGFEDEPALPDSAAVEAARELVGWRRLRPQEDPQPPAGGARERRTWSLDGPTARLDLGGIAKGYGVDRAAEILAERFDGCLVNAGGDLAVRGVRADGEAWLIGVQDPRDPSELFVKLAVRGQMAVATSGDYQRFFEAGGVRYHHLLDPRTGWPARALRSATVIAKSCALADAWATAAFVLGPEKGLAKLQAEDGVEGVLVEEDPDGGLVLHTTSGFDAYRAR